MALLQFLIITNYSQRLICSCICKLQCIFIKHYWHWTWSSGPDPINRTTHQRRKILWLNTTRPNRPTYGWTRLVSNSALNSLLRRTQQLAGSTRYCLKSPFRTGCSFKPARLRNVLCIHPLRQCNEYRFVHFRRETSFIVNRIRRYHFVFVWTQSYHA